MKNGKIILSLVALVCTVAGALAMKSHNFTGRKQCFTTVTNGLGQCKAVACFTVGTQSHNSACPGPSGTKFYTNNNGCHQVSYCTTAL